MGIVKLQNLRIYWNRRSGNEIILDTMSQNRFNEIMKVLHFNSNNAIQPREDPLYNKCHKVQPLADHFSRI